MPNVWQVQRDVAAAAAEAAAAAATATCVVVFNVSAIFLLNFSFEQLLASSVSHVLGLPKILTVCNNVATPWGMLREGVWGEMGRRVAL